MCELQWGPVVFWWSCFKFLLYLHMTITFLDGIRCVLGQKMPPLLSTPAEHTVLSGLYPRKKNVKNWSKLTSESYVYCLHSISRIY